SRELHIVNMETKEAVSERFEMQQMMNEAEVFLDLSMAGIMPVDQVGAGEFAKEELVIGLDRQLLKSLAIFDSEFDGASFGFWQDFLQLLGHTIDERFLPRVQFFADFGAEFLVFGAFLFASRGHFQQLAGVVLDVDAAAVQDDDGSVNAVGELK